MRPIPIRASHLVLQAFRHRSGRVIAVTRIVLALVFFFAVWVDPNQPARDVGMSYLLLAGYIAFGFVLAAISWSSWRLDFALAKPSHAIDVFVFLLGVVATEGYTSTFTSPFFGFFAFLVLSATLRWGWRSALATAATATLLYFLIGIAIQMSAAVFDPYRFGRRVTYLVVLSFVLIWFGINDEDSRKHQSPSDLDISPTAVEPPMLEIIRHALGRFNGRRAIFFWSERQEPWLFVDSIDRTETHRGRLSPTEFEQTISRVNAEGPLIFDMALEQALVCKRNQRGFERIARPIAQDFGERFALTRGIAVPVRSADYEGELLVMDVPGLCSDDLRIAEALASDINTALDRYSVVSLAEAAAVNRAKLGLARDLHDNVAQVLAGSAFRLEALRNWIRAGRDPEAELVAVQELLRAEQQNVRGFIARLRGVEPGVKRGELVQSVGKLCAHLTRQWGLACTVTSTADTINASLLMEQEVHHLLREAVANAARHGKARAVRIALSADEAALHLDVSDDGLGFRGGDGANKESKPWSLHERTKSLGGTLSLVSSREGAKVMMMLPRELDA